MPDRKYCWVLIASARPPPLPSSLPSSRSISSVKSCRAFNAMCSWRYPCPFTKHTRMPRTPLRSAEVYGPAFHDRTFTCIVEVKTYSTSAALLLSRATTKGMRLIEEKNYIDRRTQQGEQAYRLGLPYVQRDGCTKPTWCLPCQNEFSTWRLNLRTRSCLMCVFTPMRLLSVWKHT
jgi:hypothetical protein